MLIDKGANLNSVDNENSSALHYAAENGNNFNFVQMVFIDKYLTYPSIQIRVIMPRIFYAISLLIEIHSQTKICAIVRRTRNVCHLLWCI